MPVLERWERWVDIQQDNPGHGVVDDENASIAVMVGAITFVTQLLPVGRGYDEEGEEGDKRETVDGSDHSRREAGETEIEMIPGNGDQELKKILIIKLLSS